MGAPLLPVVANFFMEDLKQEALKRATHKAVCWFRYVDDTFMIWPHGWEMLDDYHLTPTYRSPWRLRQMAWVLTSIGDWMFLRTYSVQEDHTHWPKFKCHVSPPSGKQTCCALHPALQSQGCLSVILTVSHKN
jgi:hypothetical protein